VGRIGLLVPWTLVMCLHAEGPLEAPPELAAFARQAMSQPMSTRGKLEALLHRIFDPTDQGGLGMAYANERTRSVSEAWVEHRANCLTLTALYVAACRAAGLDVHFAEVTNVNRWQRYGSTIRFERHVVALVRVPPLEDLVADFLPRPRRRAGNYLVNLLPEKRVLALYHSNRAVEILEAGSPEEALREARRSLEVDPLSGIGWNIQGAVLGRMGRHEEAEASFRKALALDPRDGAAMGNLEGLLLALGRHEEAAHYREMGQEVRKRDPYFRSSLAEESLGEGRLEEALKHAKASVKLQPHDPELFLVLGRVHLALGDSKAALKALEKAKKLASPEEQARYESKMAIIRGGKLGP